MYGGNYPGPYGDPNQMQVQQQTPYQGAPQQQQMMGQQPMADQQQQMMGQQPMMDQQQQMMGQQPMMDQQQMPPGQPMPGQEPAPSAPEESPGLSAEEKGKPWSIVTILIGAGIGIVAISLLVLSFTGATEEVNLSSILALVAGLIAIVGLACALLLKSGFFSMNKAVPGSTGVLGGIIAIAAGGMGFSDLGVSVYVLIVGALLLLVGGILGFLVKPPEEPSKDTGMGMMESEPLQQMPPEQQFPGQQPMMDQQQMPPEQQFPGQQPMQQQAFPGQQPMQQQALPGQQPMQQQPMLPGQQPMQQQAFPGQQPMQQQQMPPGSPGGFPPFGA